jgi:microcystin-dependent protein
MAAGDKKITEFTAVTSPSSNDVIVIRDDSEEEVKKIKVTTLAQYSVPPFRPGDIKWTCRQTADEGFLICDGRAVPRVLYPILFDVIGITYGAGDGTTTFNLPNFMGRVPIAATGDSDEFDSAGNSGGETTVEVGVTEMAEHDHGIEVATDGGSTMFMYQTGPTMLQIPGLQIMGPDDTGYTGGDDPHNNVQPYLVVSTAQIRY